MTDRVIKSLVSASLILTCTVAMAAVPEFVYLDFPTFVQTRNDYRSGESAAQAQVDKLVARADVALVAPITAVIEKTGVAASGDPHDYLTIAPYFWPDPAQPDGKPFIRHDGKVNPMARDNSTDYNAKDALFENLPVLVDAYFFTGTPAYRDRALAWLDTWFVNPQTRMNPHLNYAQGIPGVNDGRCFGIIEWTGIGSLITAVQILQVEQALPADMAASVHQWFSDYAHWLRFSELGQEEGTRLNNHGTWYDVQLVGLLLFVDEPDQARAVLEAAKTQRIPTQIEPDGSQPHELARTKSLSYSTMNLRGFVQLAIFGQKLDVDLWGFTTPDGRSIRRAFTFLEPYYNGRETWSHPQLSGLEDGLRSLKNFANSTEDRFGPITP